MKFHMRNSPRSWESAETAVKKQLHNMRQRYRSLLRDEVSQTVEDPADVDDEIRYLCASLATGTE